MGAYLIRAYASDKDHTSRHGTLQDLRTALMLWPSSSEAWCSPILQESRVGILIDSGWNQKLFGRHRDALASFNAAVAEAEDPKVYWAYPLLRGLALERALSVRADYLEEEEKYDL
jgi:hypothetical protein